jgi:hypothetical protein
MSHACRRGRSTVIESIEYKVMRISYKGFHKQAAFIGGWLLHCCGKLFERMMNRVFRSSKTYLM